MNRKKGLDLNQRRFLDQRKSPACQLVQPNKPMILVSFVVIIIIVLLLGAILYSAHQENLAGEAAKKAAAKKKIKSSASLQTEIITKLKPQFQLRQSKMSALIGKDPAAVLRIAYPKTFRKNLNPALRAYVEEEVIKEGTLTVEHSDDFDQEISQFSYYLDTTDGKHFKLQFADKGPALLSGSVVQVQGIQVGEQIAVRSSGGKDVAILQAKLLSSTLGHGFYAPTGAFSTGQQITVGEPVNQVISQDEIISSAEQLPFTVKTVAVILFNFQNDQSKPFTEEFIQKMIFTGSESVKAYYQEASFKQLILGGKNNPDTGDVYGWFTIPYENTYCEPNGRLSTSLWRLAVNDAALAAGIDLSGYDHYIYIFPQTSACGWQGLAQIGGSISMINADPFNFSTGTVAHELGHNFGTHHANSYTCNDGRQRVALSPYCQYKEYGDIFDVMGTTKLFRHFNTYHKRELGWFSATEWIVVADEGEVEVDLTPLEQEGEGIKFLRVERGSNLPGNPPSPTPDSVNSFYLEFRQPTGIFDNFNLTEPVIAGISLRLGQMPGDFTPTYLIDSTPATETLEDAALPAGQTFVDEISGISITTESVSSTKAKVRVVKAPPTVCYHGIPSIVIEPVSQAANSAGQTLTYAAYIKNNDSPVCAPQTISITFDPAFFPAGWSSSPPAAEIPLSPGQEAIVNFAITSPATASLGVYAIQLWMSSAGNDEINPYFSTPAELDYWIYECAAGICTSPCGNGAVNTGENCKTCPLDVNCP